MDDQRTDREGGAGLTAAISIVLVLAGFVMACPIYDLCYSGMTQSAVLWFLLLPVTFAMRFGGALAIGMGLSWPFKKPWLGVALGILIFANLVLFKLLTDPPE